MKIYNRFHDRSEKSENIARLRALHVEMDQVAAAYGWSDLARSSSCHLGHGFHTTKHGERYTLSEPVRPVLDRLLALNHKRMVQKAKSLALPPQSTLMPEPKGDLFE
jgi:hypothetical protein